MVLADIPAFYENIDIGLLLSDLRQAEAPSPAIEQIGVCLNRWAQSPGRGIPQGQSASDILAKLYLNNVDQALRDLGYVHLRYVDDVRLFCETEVQSKHALVALSRLLRARGLSLQAAKTRIYTPSEATKKIEGATAILRDINRDFIDDVIRETGLGDPYISVHQADEILDASPDDAPLEIIRQAYSDYCVNTFSPLNATLFRFLLNRLAKQRDSFAAEHCLTLLEPHPEETSYILNYFGAIGPGEELEAQIVALMEGGHVIYDYQRYQIIEWFFERQSNPSERLINLVRALAFDATSPTYVRSVCRCFLGKFGTAADLERLALEYEATADPVERAEIICAIQRMERGRRNTLLGRFERDGEASRLAVRLVRGL